MQRGRDATKTKKLLIETAYQLYSTKTIESVTYQEISNTCGISMATIFRHYPHKQDLVIAVATAMWHRVWEMMRQEKSARTLEKYSAIRRLEYMLDSTIRLFKKEPGLLRLNADFDSYTLKEKMSAEQLKDYYDAVAPIRESFIWMYDKAAEDHTVRTDIAAKELFYDSVYTMISSAGRYACGTIWPQRSSSECVKSLEHLKTMILAYCTQNTEA